MVIGFQEIVPLTAQQIVQADPEKKSVAVFLFRLTTDPLLIDVYGRIKFSKRLNDDQAKSPTIYCYEASRYLCIENAVGQAHSVIT